VASGSRARVGRVAWSIVGLLARGVGAGALFWLVFPLWLGIFWRVQGYPPTQSDLVRWYALGAFNLAPIMATVGVSPLVSILLLARTSLMPLLSVSSSVTPSLENATRAYKFRRYALPFASALLHAVLVPPVSHALLLMYAEMWHYRAWDAIMPTLMRAYGFVGGAAFAVGWVIGWSICPSRRRAPAGAVAPKS